MDLARDDPGERRDVVREDRLREGVGTRTLPKRASSQKTSERNAEGASVFLALSPAASGSHAPFHAREIFASPPKSASERSVRFVTFDSMPKLEEKGSACGFASPVVVIHGVPLQRVVRRAAGRPGAAEVAATSSGAPPGARPRSPSRSTALGSWCVARDVARAELVRQGRFEEVARRHAAHYVVVAERALAPGGEEALRTIAGESADASAACATATR